MEEKGNVVENLKCPFNGLLWKWQVKDKLLLQSAVEDDIIWSMLI